jgi:hypothetical protein
MDDLGWKFWLWVVGVSLAIGIGGMLLFLLIGAAWYSWGVLGALVFFGAIMLAYGYIYDRRNARRYEDETTWAADEARARQAGPLR